MREAQYDRKTKETEISVKVNLDGKGKSNVKTGIKILDHMIETISMHSLIDIEVSAKGDLTHHLIEDIALSLGTAINKALGNRESLIRFGYSIIPMDCSLVIVAIDLVKRQCSIINLKLESKEVEDIKSEDIYHFLTSFTTSLNATLHIQVQYGENDHHKLECAFKALALSMRQAISKDIKRNTIASTKGIL